MRPRPELPEGCSADIVHAGVYPTLERSDSRRARTLLYLFDRAGRDRQESRSPIQRPEFSRGSSLGSDADVVESAELLGAPRLLAPARIAFSVAKGGIEFHRFLAPLLSLSAVAIRR